MASQAYSKFNELILKANLLSQHAGKLKLKKDAPAKAVFLHAALATQVAAWDVYVKALALEYFSAITNVSDVRFMELHTLCKQAMTEAKDKLNTPNSENSRVFLVKYTGFDPWSSWGGVKFGSNTLTSSLVVRERLNEILKLRHSFAHGFAMPIFNWNQNTNGAAYLTCHVVRSTSNFFASLCKSTDSAMSLHISVQHRVPRPW